MVKKHSDDNKHGNHEAFLPSKDNFSIPNKSDNPNPKYVIVDLHTGYDRHLGGITVLKKENNPAVYPIEDIISKNAPYQYSVMYFVEKHLRKYGSVNELIITGHGSKDIITNRNGNDYFNIPQFLKEYDDLVKENPKGKIKRIVFEACSVFSKLSDEEIKFYIDFAVLHKMEIVGTTSAAAIGTFLFDSIKENAARYVQFTPNGEIIRDKGLDKPFDPLSFVNNDRSWTDFYIGHTPEEAEVLRKTHELQLKNAAKAAAKRQEWENKCADRGPKI